MADELVFLKLGGSLLTDKTRPQALRRDVLQRLAGEIAGALAQSPALRLVVGHGSGSFGHFAASRYGTRAGVYSRAAWRGYAETARAAAELNRLVVAALGEAGVPALPIQPSASAVCRDGELVSMDVRPTVVSLAQGLVPVIYGDVALDEARGGTIISTEQILCWLAPRLRPGRVLLVGEVDGVRTADPARGGEGEVIRQITPASFPQIAGALGRSRGVDVTGGMYEKVAEMVELVRSMPAPLVVDVISGLMPGLVRSALLNGGLVAGTRIVAD